MDEVVREPGWLTAAADQRLALMQETVPPEVLAEDAPIVMAMLTEPSDDLDRQERERWERTCDNCGAYTPEGQVFYTGHVTRYLFGAPVMITYGACFRCSGKPFMRPERGQ